MILKISLLSLLLTISGTLSAKQVPTVEVIKHEALTVGAPPLLLVAICRVESGLKPYVTNFADGSHRNSHGLCQVQTRTALELGCIKKVADLYRPEINARCAAMYLKKHLERFGCKRLAVAAYNAGASRVAYWMRKYGRTFNWEYTNKVMDFYAKEKK